MGSTWFFNILPSSIHLLLRPIKPENTTSVLQLCYNECMTILKPKITIDTPVVHLYESPLTEFFPRIYGSFIMNFFQIFIILLLLIFLILALRHQLTRRNLKRIFYGSLIILLVYSLLMGEFSFLIIRAWLRGYFILWIPLLRM